MIRFVDMRPASIAGIRFSFWDTSANQFISVDNESGWETWDEFMLAKPGYAYEFRFKPMCPTWAFIPETTEEYLEDRFGVFDKTKMSAAVTALKMCAETFRRYETNHKTKSEDGNLSVFQRQSAAEKAIVNSNMAEMCDRVVAGIEQ